MTVRSWAQKLPDEHIVADDKVCMFNMGKRTAMFKALRSRREFCKYVPVFRVFYAVPARIFLGGMHAGQYMIEVVTRVAATAETVAVLRPPLEAEGEGARSAVERLVAGGDVHGGVRRHRRRAARDARCFARVSCARDSGA